MVTAVQGIKGEKEMFSKSGDLHSSEVEGARGDTLKVSMSIGIQFFLLGKGSEWQECGNGGTIKEVSWYLGYIWR